MFLLYYLHRRNILIDILVDILFIYCHLTWGIHVDFNAVDLNVAYVVNLIANLAKRDARDTFQFISSWNDLFVGALTRCAFGTHVRLKKVDVDDRAVSAINRFLIRAVDVDAEVEGLVVGAGFAVLEERSALDGLSPLGRHDLEVLLFVFSSALAVDGFSVVGVD